ncbi:lamin tail domain-containing protein [Frondihabitans sp. VKM Ac-2883]|uniref:lamin tail domain-containing protein n=1 Tax=Frondihabitans sp. VKM Ac-2883 TaxID=2783823 RepID=UPI00188D866B|nr:lamin tail domain-containing protein [Frondihabitans sp. VKM Ac-2883]MBF4575412.1 lamin tail domain-containing protein [Frondihabitans sp. VKM Ac-2883]
MRPPLLRAGALTLTGTLALSGLVLLTAAPASAATSDIVINEIESTGGSPDDWIELGNPTGSAIDASGMILRDNKDTDTFVLPTGSLIAAGGYLTVDTVTATTPDGFDFGLGGADSVRLFQADGTTLVDSYAWTTAAATTYGRSPDLTGSFAVTSASTKNAANAFETAVPDPEPTDPTDPADPTPTDPTDPTPADPAANADGLSINEVESNGDDTDWVEVINTSDTALDLSGYGFVDSDASHAKYRLPAGSIVDPGDYFVIDQATTTEPEGFDFGLGAADSVSLYDRADALAATYSWTTHSLVTYGRCPDGTGDFTTTTTSTKGDANNCSSPVRINEVESNGGTPGDWVELTNIGAASVDVSGYVFRDNKDTDSYAVPAGTTIAPGAFVVLDEKTDSTPNGFDFGLGGADSARLFLADGTTLVDSYDWTEHAATTYGRSPDGTGDFETTSEPSRGSANLFDGAAVAEQWPGSPDETPLDDESTYTGDLSGLDYEPSGSAADGTIWGVENGTGRLYKIVSDGAGGWAPATTAGWAGGKVLHYADGTGTVDAEGVTVADDSSAGGIYVSSERNNDVSGTSRPSVLRYDPSTSATVLNATAEWNLAADFPTIGANAGLEGVTWIPDSLLTDAGFADESTGAEYDPADYAGHGDGLFFVGVEGTASVYAYALMSDGSFRRIASIPTTFGVVADVQFDADLGQLWVVCDDACAGQTALFSIDSAGSFVQDTLYNAPANADPALANEGFAIAPAATTVDGARLTFYADDNDTDGFSFRVGSFPSEPPTTPGDGAGDGDNGGSGDGSGDGDVVSGTAGSGGTATDPDAAAAAPTALAYTGSEPAPLAALGALLLALGVASLVAVRRRRAA